MLTRLHRKFVEKMPGADKNKKRNTKSKPVANLASQLDTVSDDEGLVAAIEVDLSKDSKMTEPFFDATDENHVNDASQIPLTDEEKDKLKAELTKTEEEINTLRQVLQARLKHSNELKRKLGLTPWQEVYHDVQTGIKTVKDTPAYQKTEEVLHQVTDKTNQVVSNLGKKLGDLRSSNTFKSIEAGVGSAYSNVKKSCSQARLVASQSVYGGFGGNGPNATAETEDAGADPTAQAKSVPTTPAKS